MKRLFWAMEVLREVICLSLPHAYGGALGAGGVMRMLRTGGVTV